MRLSVYKLINAKATKIIAVFLAHTGFFVYLCTRKSFIQVQMYENIF